MPIASVRARPRMYGTNIVPDASGLRPIASIAFEKPMPRPMPGPMAPIIARPAAMVEMFPSTLFSCLLTGACGPAGVRVVLGGGGLGVLVTASPALRGIGSMAGIGPLLGIRRVPTVAVLGDGHGDVRH